MIPRPKRALRPHRRWGTGVPTGTRDRCARRLVGHCRSRWLPPRRDAPRAPSCVFVARHPESSFLPFCTSTVIVGPHVIAAACLTACVAADRARGARNGQPRPGEGKDRTASTVIESKANGVTVRFSTQVVYMYGVASCLTALQYSVRVYGL